MNIEISKNTDLPDNTITTTKYNLFTFVLTPLLFQFSRAANIYFLLISILTCMPFSPKQPSSMIGTFAFVLICTMIKEAIEDYSRYKQDNLSNIRNVLKFEKGRWNQIKCKNLRPGDIIKVTK